MDREEVLKNLREKGFCVIDNYWTREQCEKSLKEIEHMNQVLFVKGQGGDIRCQHSNKYLKTANDFFTDPFINQVSKEYSACHRPDRTVLGIVRPVGGTKVDSGGGWHVDSEQEHQFKSMIYLTDVGTDNGPFMFASESRMIVPSLQKYSNLRIFDNEIREKIESKKLVEITGKAGTCIVVDTTYPHRGKEIVSGTRYSYTTYYYYENGRKK